MNGGPTKAQFAEFLAIIDKLIIQSNQSLSPVEKEILKQGIDEIKRMAQQL